MFKKLILIVNFIATLLLGLSYLASIIRPETFWIVPIFGLAYPVLVLINVCFIIIWLIFKPVYLLLPLSGLLIGWNIHQRYLGINGKHTLEPHMLKVMSYNVKNFDVYNYTPDWDYQFENRNSIFQLLSTENPDIICFQEYYDERAKVFKTTDTIPELTDAKNYHIEFLVENRNNARFGIATYTKYPIIKKGKVQLPSRNVNSCIFTDILFQNDTIRVYNLHFESIRFRKEDYQFAKEISSHPSDKSEEEIKKHTKSIIKKLKTAFELRSTQAKIVAEHIAQCPHPVILCGDFNDTPISYAYAQINQHLSDAFINAGFGLGSSYAGKEIPAYRIDYIFHSKEFTPYNFRTIHKEYSDHYPITSYMELNP